MRLVRLEGGAPVLEVGYSRILFDSAWGTGVRCISHAHMDHAGSPGSVNLMTGETMRIFASRRKYYKKFIESTLGVKISILEGATITALNSGHMLGSSLFNVEADGLSVVYTGDMNVYDSILQKGAEQLEGDVLILEATYGSPVYKFPERERIYYEIVKWVSKTLAQGEIPAFKAYTAGKAQELVALINSTVQTPVVVGPEVFSVSRVYKNTYPWMDFLRKGSREGDEALKGGAVYISPTIDTQTLHGRRLRWALVTGWTLTHRQEGFSAYFPLSAHSDFFGLVSYAKNSDYKTVLTIYGYSPVLARHLRRLGLKAYALEEKMQIRL
ncbi:MAG: hypothetical protein QXW50_03190 [Nitrososphaerota archaeon]